MLRLVWSKAIARNCFATTLHLKAYNKSVATSFARKHTCCSCYSRKLSQEIVLLRLSGPGRKLSQGLLQQTRLKASEFVCYDPKKFPIRLVELELPQWCNPNHPVYLASHPRRSALLPLSHWHHPTSTRLTPLCLLSHQAIRHVACCEVKSFLQGLLPRDERWKSWCCCSLKCQNEVRSSHV